MVKARKFVYVKPFDGMPTTENVQIAEEELPALKDGEFLAEAVYLSVDPYMRAYSHSYKIGQTMIGGQVAKITESKNPKFPVGGHVMGNFGWRSHTISNGKAPMPDRPFVPYLLPNDRTPLSLYLGILGMPGNTAYFGLLDICEPKAGEVVVVSGAAGAVGSHVGQIAKLKGCTVIGICGTDEKAKWIKELGFDHTINYKTTKDLAKTLRELAPKGIDIYFDNVGGEMSSTIIHQMNRFGRISACGSISSYNDSGELVKATIIQPPIVFKELKMQGFIVSTYIDRWMEGIQANAKWLKEGKLKYNEWTVEGFDNMLNALIGILRGDNTGKAIVKV